MDLNASIRPEADTQLAELLREPRLVSRVAESSIQAIADAAGRHGVAGLLLDRANRQGVSPDPRWRAVRDRAAGQSTAAAWRDAESHAVLRSAAAAEIPFVVLKGLALAYSVYPEPWLRERSDTDLLVRESDLPRFDRLFLNLGYSVLPHVRGELILPQRHYQRDDRIGFRQAWDLHWRLTSSLALGVALSESGFWARAVRLEPLDGALVPCRADSLMLACVHRLAHHFDDRRLIWLWDIRLLLEAMTQTELEMFSEMSGGGEAAAACGHSLAVAEREAGARIPAQLRRLLDTRPSSAAFLWSGSRRRVTYLLGEVRAARGGDRLRLLREHLLPSFSSMRERYPSVPRVLLPFAYAWRLVLGVPRWMRAR